MTTVNMEILKESLDKLSSKQHVVSDEALYAKKVLDDQKKSSFEIAEEQHQKRDQLLQEFNTSIRLLMRVFQESKFDHVLGVAMNPLRMLVLNFCIGVVRGLGFVIGVLLILSILSSVFFDLSEFLSFLVK